MTREGRRESLLAAAAEVVDDGGVAACTFEAMARRAGVAKTLPYAYFESVDEVLVALFDQVVGPVDDQIEAALAGGGAFDDLVRRSLAVWFDAVRSHGRLLAALLDGRATPGLAERVRMRDRRSHRLWRDVVAQHSGLPDTDAHVLAATLNAGATSLVQLWVSRRGRREELIESFVAMAAGAADGLVASAAARR